MPAPDLPAASRDLSDAEFRALDELLAALPEPLMPMDVVMLDGYLCGVIVQPTLVAAEQWLPPVFDIESRALPADVAGRERLVSLVLRRHAALNRALLEVGWFDPLILEDDDETDDDDVASDEPDPLAGMNPVSRPLMPWVVGFQTACVAFPALLESEDEAVMTALARLFRHLPAESEDEREVVATLDREMPLASLDDAIEELVASVADLADLTQDDRYRVETVRRETPKVGRNDPCPCGSGKKYKHCHGAG
ncbi:MAG: UPF0149 family protein [Burkholderiales bacterium]